MNGARNDDAGGTEVGDKGSGEISSYEYQDRGESLKLLLLLPSRFSLKLADHKKRIWICHWEMSSYPPESLNEKDLKWLALEMKTRRPTEMETEKVTLHFKSFRNFFFFWGSWTPGWTQGHCRVCSPDGDEDHHHWHAIGRLDSWLPLQLTSALGSKYYHKFPLRNVLQKRQDVSCTFKILRMEDFPGGPVVNTLPSNAGGASWILGQEAKIPHALQQTNKQT